MVNPTLKKRQKIIISSLILTFGLLSTQSVGFFFLRYRFILALGVLSAVLTLWSIREGLTKLKATVLLILPLMFSIAVASFYFLLPVRWLTRLPVALIFGLSFYSLLLSQNVFNVASSRTIPLYRAASTVSFLFTLITAFFLYNVVFALNLPFYWNGVAVFMISLPLILQLLWSVSLDTIDTKILIYSLVLSLILGEGAIALSFWPIMPTIWSLALSTFLYVLGGMISEFMRERLNSKTVWEYISVGGLVFIFSFFITSWAG